MGFALNNLGFSRVEIETRVEQVISRFKLKEYRKQYPRSLSGGEKQRVALASVISVRPEILVLDEPSRGMDQRFKNELMVFLRDYAEQGNTVVLVTHDVETVAEYAGRVILMSEGEIVADGN